MSRLAGNLKAPQEFKLSIGAVVSEREMTVDELVSLNDPVDDDQD